MDNLTTGRLTKDEAQQLEDLIIQGATTFAEETGPMLLRMRDERGWEALGHKSFKEYAATLQDKMGISSAYNYLNAADVNASLSKSTGRVVKLPLRHALALKDLEPEQRLLAFNEATSGGQEVRPSEKVFARAASKVAPAKSKKRKASTASDHTDGWTKDDLAKDQELAIAFGQLRGLYGDSDAKAIQNGTIGYRRADVIQLSKLPKPKLMEIQDLVFANRWTPKECLEFLGKMPDKYSTVEELQNYALATKGKFFTADIEGFTITCKANRAALRR